MKLTTRPGRLIALMAAEPISLLDVRDATSRPQSIGRCMPSEAAGRALRQPLYAECLNTTATMLQGEPTLGR